MLEKDFQSEVIKFLKSQNIYYIKVWRRRISKSWNTRYHNLFKRIIYSS